MSHSRSRDKRPQPQHHQQMNRGGGNPNPRNEDFSRRGFQSGGSSYGERAGRNYGPGQYGAGRRDEPEYGSEQNNWDDEEKGRQFGSSWRSGNTQRESGNRDWVSGVGQGDYRESRERDLSPGEYPYNEVAFNRGMGPGMRRSQGSMGGGTWGSEGGGGWSSGSQSQSKRQSFAGRGPQGYRRSDERITEDINEELTQDDELDASGISVEVKNGEVLLKGQVPDRESKRRAEEIAESCSGVKDVQNQIRVKREDSHESDDNRREKSGEKMDDKRTRLAS